MNSYDNTHIPGNSFLPNVQTCAILEHFPIYMVQDRSPIHNCRIVREWVSHQIDIQLLNWLPKGCDMNPMENV